MEAVVGILIAVLAIWLTIRIAERHERKRWHRD